MVSARTRETYCSKRTARVPAAFVAAAYPAPQCCISSNLHGLLVCIYAVCILLHLFDFCMSFPAGHTGEGKMNWSME